MSGQQRGRSLVTPSSPATSQSVCQPPASRLPHTLRGHIPEHTPLTPVGGAARDTRRAPLWCFIGCHVDLFLSAGLLRRPLMDVNLAPMEVDQPPVKGVGMAAAVPPSLEGDDTPADWHLGTLLKQLTACLDSKPTEKPPECYGTPYGVGTSGSGTVMVLPHPFPPK